jgi:rubrerythrin
MTGMSKEPTETADGDEVVFAVAGDHVKGEYRCSECGYGITVCRDLPKCPMCSCEVWEAVSWGPFGRALASSQSPTIRR